MEKNDRGGALNKRSTNLVRVDGALKQYKLVPSLANLDYVEECARFWNATTKTVSASRTHAYDQLIKAISTEKERLQKLDNVATERRLREAALLIVNKFNADIHEHYLGALRKTFVSPPEGHTYCYRRFSDNGWKSHLLKVYKVDGSDIGSHKGVTPTIAAQELNRFPNFPKENFPPYDRLICFPVNSTTLHNLVHEMLHWCCHEQFRVGERCKGVKAEDFEFCRESITEYLARLALPAGSQDAQGGYQHYMSKIEYIISEGDGHVPLDDVKKAYFKGEKVGNLLERMIRCKDSELNEEQKQAGRIAALNMTKNFNDPNKVSETISLGIVKAFERCQDTDRHFQELSPAWREFIRKK